MSDFMLPNEDETALKDFMTSGLTTGPKISTAALMAMARIKRRRARTVVASLAAVLLLCLYATSPLVLPALARAISAVPGVGPSFEQALKIHSLDLAYEAGLLATLDKSIDRDGVTLTVHSAYRDAHTFNILISIHGDPEFMEKLAGTIGPRVELSSGRWKASGSYSSRLYDEEDSILFVSMNSWDPLPWYIRKMSVSVEWMINEDDMEKYKTHISWDTVETSDPLMVSFPLQRATDKYTQVIPINQTILTEKTTIQLESLVLTPVRTILNYKYTGLEPFLDLLDDNGEEIRGFVGGGGQNVYEATQSKEFTIRFRGHHVNCDVEAPLLEGYEHVGDPSFRIESITPTHKLLPWIRQSVAEDGKPVIEDVYADTKVVLSWNSEQWRFVNVNGGHTEWLHDETSTFYLVREGVPEEQPILLTFTRWGGEQQEIKVTR